MLLCLNICRFEFKLASTRGHSSEHEMAGMSKSHCSATSKYVSLSLQLYIQSDSDRRIHSNSILIPKSILKFGMASVRMSRQRPVSERQRLLLHFTRVCAHVGTSVPPRPDARAPSGSCARMHAGPCTPASIPLQFTRS